MEIESFWNGLPGYRGMCKGKNGRIGYGYVYKHYNRNGITKYRKAYRQIRKYGFDISEAWTLDITIMEWLSDNVGGFWKKCGPFSSWTEYDLNGNYYDFWEFCNEDIYFNLAYQWEKTRCDSFLKHLKDFLDNSNENILNDFRKFVIPRLRKLADISQGWPANNDFPKFEDWIKEINNMADKFEQGTYTDTFITYFFNLAD